MYLDTGKVIPVTVLECPSNIVKNVKTTAKEGYDAVCLTAFPKKNPSKNQTHYFTGEIRTSQLDGVETGNEISLKDFGDVKEVNIVGISKGKGFQGVVKRYHFKGGPASHGSKFGRTPGSRGTRKPNKSSKGMRSAGRMGCDRITLKHIEIMKIDVENNLIALKGSIPGAKNSFVTLIAQ